MIRPAGAKDIPELMRLLRQVNNVHAKGRPDLFLMDRTKYSEEELETLLKDESRPVFVYPKGEGILGYAFCVWENHEGDHNQADRRTLYIDDICVDEDARGQHVGTSLYQFVRVYAKEHGCYNLTLNGWSLNPGAYAFYEAMGMKPYKVGMEEILR